MNKNLVVLSALAAALLAGASSARAALQLRLATAGATTINVTDNGAGDSDPTVGQIAFNGSIGNFATVITAGTSNSPGANGLAILQTHTISVRETTAARATLTVTLGDTSFTNPSGANLQMGSSFSGTFLSSVAGESVSFQSFADPSNTALGTAITSGLHTASLVNGSQAPVGFTTADRSATFTANGPYSLSDVTVINLSQNGQANVAGTTSVIAPAGSGVPEPASLGVLALGAMGLIARRRRA